LKIASNLSGVVKEIKIIGLPGLKESEDVVDWEWEYGGTKEKLLEIVQNTSVWTPKGDAFSFTASQDIGGCETVKLKLTTVEEILNYPEPEFLVNGLIEKNSLNILSAESGIGKTLLAFALAKSLVTGEKFLGKFEIKKKCKVLIVDEENSKPHLRERIEKMGFTKDMQVCFLHFQGIKLDDLTMYSSLMAIIDSLKPDFIIFDALIRLHDRDENSNSEMSKVMSKLREIVGKTDATVLVIHHDKKSSEGSAKLKARGASDIIGAVDCHLSLEKKNDDTLILSPGKTRSNTFEPIVLKFNPDSFNFEMLGMGSEGIKNHKDIEILNTIKMVLENQKMTYEEIKEGLKEKKYEIGGNRLRKILNDNFSKAIMAHGKTLYSINSSFTDDKNTGREAGIPENTGTEGSFTVSQGVYSTETCEAEKPSQRRNDYKSEPAIIPESDVYEMSEISEVVE
jgi:hypothetical protein